MLLSSLIFFVVTTDQGSGKDHFGSQTGIEVSAITTFGNFYGMDALIYTGTDALVDAKSF